MNDNVKKVNSQNKNPAIKKFLKFSIISFLLLLFVVIGLIAGTIIGFVQATDPISADDLILKGFTTYVFDNKQNIISPLQGDKNREMIDIKITPKNLRNAFIAIEDKRFYEHPGIDIKRMSGAVLNFLSTDGGSYGASTITQQVIKNLTGQQERSIKRKVQEQWKALELERHLTKDQILEIYMNIIYMGHNCYGVQSASKMYFNKDVSKLDLAECAIIAGITNAPSNYDPFSVKGLANIKKRQEIILEEMYKMGNISLKERNDSIDQQLIFAPNNKNLNLNTSVQSYFIDQVVKDVKNDLVAKGYSDELAVKMIYNNGLKIYSTMDISIQKSMDEVFANAENFPAFQKKQMPQASMVILDVKNSQVRAIYGGAGPKSTNSRPFFNRATATDMSRQPGSTFKPIAVYGPAIDTKRITSATVLDDVPVRLDKKNPKRYPENYDLSYNGLMTVRGALKISLNVVASKIWLIDPGFPQTAFQYLKKVNINRENENYVSTALGGLNVGVNPLKMAAAYVPFANRGVYYEPITYTKVLDSKGKVILENKRESVLVYEPETAYIMTSLLSEVTSAGGTAEKYGKLRNGEMPSAGKTGTTSDNKDKWFIGFSPYYVGATWYGYDTPSSLVPDEFSQAQKLWHDVMEKVHAKLPTQILLEPSGIEKKTTCMFSGKTPSSLCSRDLRGYALREEVFISGTQPSDNDICDVHVKVSVCKDSRDEFGRKLLFGQNCPDSSREELVMVKRSQPFNPQVSGDPYPQDWKYEKPDKYCRVHNSISSVNEVPVPTITDDTKSTVPTIINEEEFDNKAETKATTTVTPTPIDNF